MMYLLRPTPPPTLSGTRNGYLPKAGKVCGCGVKAGVGVANFSRAG